MPNLKIYWTTIKKHWVITTVFLYLLFILGYTLIFLYQEQWKIIFLPSNELGDFLAEAFAPLAFFILIMGYNQQGKELKQNTAALQLQADELRITNETLVLQTEELKKMLSTKDN